MWMAKKMCAVAGSLVLAATGWAAETIVDFEQAEIGARPTQWEEKGVLFQLAHAPKQTKAKPRMVFFPHLGTGHKGILCAMAMEPIPVEIRFPKGVSAVTLKMWGSTGCAAIVEAFDQAGAMIDRTELAEVPRRLKPEEPVPFFEMTVRGEKIAYVRFSGPRAGEFLATDEVRFVPAE
jgi:hypothetical protein